MGGGEHFIETTGVERHREAKENICTSDLCISAAEKLLEQLQWDKNSIDVLLFVTQTPDYILPATSCIIQDRLGLSQNTYTLDISLGCSGWVYGMSVLASLLEKGCVKRGLLLCGDTTSKTKSPEDKSTYCLFGDTGTVTALEFDKNASQMFFDMQTDGSGANAIIIEDGGYRNPVNAQSFNMREKGEDVILNNLQCYLDGMSVFSFGISKAPKSVKSLLEYFSLNKEDIDVFTFHQANLFMNEKIRKKLGLPSDKVPYCLKDFGNTSSASIPLTLVVERQQSLQSKKLKHVVCGFGVGLSWGSIYFETNKIVVPNLVEI